MTIEQQPQLVEAFLTAFDRGLQDAIANPAVAMLASAEYVEGLASPEDIDGLLEWSVTRAELLSRSADAEVLATDLADMRGILGEQLEASTLVQLDVLLTTISNVAGGYYRLQRARGLGHDCRSLAGGGHAGRGAGGWVGLHQPLRAGLR